MSCSKTLLEHFRCAYRNVAASRPTSFYLLFALLAIALLGSQVYFIRRDPERLGLFLALNFTVCFVVIFIALLDCRDIIRRTLRERRRAFRETLGDDAFLKRMRERTGAKRGQP